MKVDEGRGRCAVGALSFDDGRGEDWGEEGRCLRCGLTISTLDQSHDAGYCGLGQGLFRCKQVIG